MKDKIVEVFATIIGLGTVVLLLLLDALFPTTSEEQKKHECINFVKYQEHYQITPMTWGYRDSFKCIECKKDWKNN